MTDDATLSEFAATGTESDGDSSTDAGSRSARTDPAADETARSTYAWGEYTCHRCEGATERVWRADGDLVCPNCKEW